MSIAPLALHPAPFIQTTKTTPGIMRDVLLALIPPLLMALYSFGPAALLIVGASTAGAVLTERIFSPQGRSSLLDNSGLLTGLLLGLTLPPGMPLWMAFVGGVVGMGLGKLIWGGLGQNLFNPALVGRAFLQAAFPTAITTWPARGDSWFSMPASVFAPPMLHLNVDAVTAATPLGLQKFENISTELGQLALGATGGSLGETSALVIAICGLWLYSRRAFDWHIPVSMLTTVVLFSGALYLWNPAVHPTPWFMLSSGGLMFGAVYMATDPVTSPTTSRGTLLFGVGVGLLVVLIRRFGGLPEGVMYAILLMNACTPLIERVSQPRPFGRGVNP